MFAEITEEAFRALVNGDTSSIYNIQEHEQSRTIDYHVYGVKVRLIQNYASYTQQYYVMDINA